MHCILIRNYLYKQIKYARKSIQGTSFESKLELKVLDYSVDRIEGTFDVVLFNSSLHHFKNIPAILEKVHANLGNGGLLVLNEYVAPDRFQWTADQLNIINNLLLSIPVNYR